jgi:hypothetical protein
LVIDVGDRLRGCGFDCDLVPEGFELTDQVPLAGLGVGLPETKLR